MTPEIHRSELEGSRREGQFPALLDRALAIPLAIPAVVVTVAFAAGIIALIQTSHPAIGDTTGIDGQAIWLGNWLLFRDPAEGYTAAGYTPLLSYLNGLLDHITVWRGWGSLLNVLASGALGVAAAALAWSPRSDSRIDRLAALVEAAGIGALAWWAVSTGFVETFQGDRPDQFAWTLALLGLLFVPAAASGSRRASWLAIGLLSAGFWAKQPALAVSGAAAVYLAIAVLARWTTLRRAVLGIAIFAVVNAAIMGILTLLTDGWEFYFNLYLPATAPVCCELSNDFSDYLYLFRSEFLASTFPLLWFTAGLGLVAIAGRMVPFAARKLRERQADPSEAPGAERNGLVVRARASVADLSPDGRITLILLIFAVVGLFAAAWARKGIGSAPNQSLGVVWAMALLGAIAYRWARPRRATAIAATAVIVVILAASAWSRGEVSFGKYEGRFSSLDVNMHWKEIAEPLVDYASDRSVYHPNYSDLSVTGAETIQPNWISLTGLFLSDHTPKALEDAIVERRFDTVWRFSDYLVDHPLSNIVEENYIWKLNELMTLKYPDENGAPGGGLERGPDRDPAPWVNDCLGPFELAGIEFRQHHGGGLWCQEGDELTVDRLPPGVFVSDVQTVDPVTALAGTLRVRTPGGPKQFEVFADIYDQLLWRVQAIPKGKDTVLTGRYRGEETDPVVVPGGNGGQDIALRFSQGDGDEFTVAATPGGATVTVPAFPEAAGLSLAASEGSGTGFDLGELSIGQ